MEAKLIVVGGKVNQRTIALKLPAVIGRSKDASLRVAHPMVSRRHCEIVESDGLLTVRDLGSLNGTLIEGRRVSEAALRPHDEFTIGPLTFRAEYEHQGDLGAVPAPKFLDRLEAEPQAASEHAVEEVTPLDPQTYESPAYESPAAEDEPDVPPHSGNHHQAAEAGKEAAGEEPEPTPSPVSAEAGLEEAFFEELAAGAGEEEPAAEVEDAAADEPESKLPSPPAAEPEETLLEETLPGPDESESEDQDLDDFLKGLQ